MKTNEKLSDLLEPVVLQKNIFLPQKVTLFVYATQPNGPLLMVLFHAELQCIDTSICSMILSGQTAFGRLPLFRKSSISRYHYSTPFAIIRIALGNYN